MARRKRLSRIAAFNKAARENGMTYGKLQVLETCGKIEVTPDGKLLWRNGR